MTHHENAGFGTDAPADNTDPKKWTTPTVEKLDVMVHTQDSLSPGAGDGAFADIS
jgi:hypothetical protein